MKTPLFFGTSTASGAATNYLGPGLWQATPTTTRSNQETVMPCAGTLSRLYVDFTGAPTAGTTRPFTIYKNGVATALTLTCGEGVTAGNDIVNTVSVAAGDLISLELGYTGAPPNMTNNHYGLLFSSDQKVSPCLSMHGVGLSASANSYLSLTGGTTTLLTTAAAATHVVPTSGTIRDAYFALQGGSPGTAKSYTATLYKNGVATSLSVQISGAGTSNSDTSNTVTVAAGDTVYWEIVPSGTPSSRRASLSCVFVPDIDGESIQTNGSNTNLSAYNTAYAAPTGTAAYSVTEAVRQGIVPLDLVTKKMYVSLSGAGGGSSSRVFAVRDDGVAVNPSVTMGAAGTTGNDTSTSSSIAAGSRINTRIVPTSSPAAVYGTWSFVTYIAPDFLPQIIIF